LASLVARARTRSRVRREAALAASRLPLLAAERIAARVRLSASIESPKRTIASAVRTVRGGASERGLAAHLKRTRRLDSILLALHHRAEFSALLGLLVWSLPSSLDASVSSRAATASSDSERGEAVGVEVPPMMSSTLREEGSEDGEELGSEDPEGLLDVWLVLALEVRVEVEVDESGDGRWGPPGPRAGGEGDEVDMVGEHTGGEICAGMVGEVFARVLLLSLQARRA
jgi:hypothetical protein